LTTLPYVVSVYMVRDFLAADDPGGIPPSEDRVGVLTGLLGASFCSAQLLTSFPLGMLSDRIGRKPIIVFGNISCVAGVLAFGVSGTYAAAVAARAVAGLLNAMIGATKAVIGDVLEPGEQAKAMGYISLAWGVGTMVGPTMGGFLARPCTPEGVLGSFGGEGVCGPGALLRRKPYLLPCAAAAVLSVVATVATALFLEESLPRLREKQGDGYQRVGAADEEASKLPARDALQKSDSASDYHRRGEDFTIKASTSPSEEDLPWYRQRNVVLSLAGYALIAFVYILLEELVPLFASAAPELGGLGWPSQKLALPMAAGGLALVLWAMYGFPWLHTKLGSVRCSKVGLWQTVPVALLIPCASLPWVPSAPWMYVISALKAISATNAFTGCLIFVNPTAPRAQLGAVNGVGQTLASLVRGAGPALGGVLWAGSLSAFRAAGVAPWGHQFLPFAFAAVVALVTLPVYAAVRLPVRTIDEERGEEAEMVALTSTSKPDDDGV
jgi:MFS family permease